MCLLADTSEENSIAGGLPAWLPIVHCHSAPSSDSTRDRVPVGLECCMAPCSVHNITKCRERWAFRGPWKSGASGARGSL